VRQEREVVLRNGQRIVVRPLAAGDAGAVAQWFDSLSSETRYERFLAPMKQLSRRLLTDLAGVDHLDREAISAVAPDGTTIGIARYSRVDSSRTAEVAVAVADQWRGLGIATALLDVVAERARASGIERFVALCLSRNHTAIRTLSKLGPTTVSSSDAGVVDVRIELRRAGSRT
jgi:RimJ/RimL family protein N-acetyltransferase